MPFMNYPKSAKVHTERSTLVGIVMTRNVMTILLILVASSRANVGLKGAKSPASSTSRGLEEARDDDTNGVSDTWSEAAPASNRTSITEYQSIIVNHVQQYKAAAESKAWEFYQSSPSEWTENQWDFVLGVFGGLLLLSCSFVSVCCAYFCVYRDRGVSSASKDRYKKRIVHHWLRLQRARRHERNYDDLDNDTATIESRSTLDSHASTNMASSFELATNDKRECLLKKSNSYKMSRASRTVNKNEGTYDGPNNCAVTNESRSTIEPISPLSESSYFEVESIKMETPQK